MSFFPTVIEESQRGGERSYDLISRMLKDRIVILNGAIEEITATSITTQLLFLESQSSTKDIVMYVNSPGGLVTAGMAIYDTMQYINAPIHTVIMGQAASMGSLLAQAGAEGHRYILPNSRHMVHQPLGGASGQASEVIIQAKELLRWKEELTNIYVKHNTAGKTYKEFEAAMDRDNYMTSQEALDFGLVDKIIDKRV